MGGELDLVFFDVDDRDCEHPMYAFVTAVSVMLPGGRCGFRLEVRTHGQAGTEDVGTVVRTDDGHYKIVDW